MSNSDMKRLLATTIIVLLVASLAAVAYGWYLRGTAESLRDDIVALVARDGSYDEAVRIAERYRGFRVPPMFSARDVHDHHFAVRPDDPCTPEQCAIAINIETGILGKLHLVRPARFSADILVLHRTVAIVGFGLIGGEGSDGGFASFVRSGTAVSELFNPTGESYSAHAKRALSVRFSDKATAAEKHDALALDLRCFVSRANCDRPCDYLPFAWRDYMKARQDEVTSWNKEWASCRT